MVRNSARLGFLFLFLFLKMASSFKTLMPISQSNIERLSQAQGRFPVKSLFIEKRFKIRSKCCSVPSITHVDSETVEAALHYSVEVAKNS